MTCLKTEVTAITKQSRAQPGTKGPHPAGACTRLWPRSLGSQDWPSLNLRPRNEGPLRQGPLSLVLLSRWRLNISSTIMPTPGISYSLEGPPKLPRIRSLKSVFFPISWILRYFLNSFYWSSATGQVGFHRRRFYYHITLLNVFLFL